MSDHDDLCLRWQQRDGTHECRCDLAAEVRMDEQMRMDPLLNDEREARIRADERERIAQAIEVKVPMPPGDSGPWEDEFYRHAYLDAARIARTGGSE